jgi:hypothetical protein
LDISNTTEASITRRLPSGSPSQVHTLKRKFPLQEDTFDTDKVRELNSSYTAVAIRTPGRLRYPASGLGGSLLHAMRDPRLDPWLATPSSCRDLAFLNPDGLTLTPDSPTPLTIYGSRSQWPILRFTRRPTTDLAGSIRTTRLLHVFICSTFIGFTSRSYGLLSFLCKLYTLLPR